jgi:predicted nucleic acid-binding protein
MVIVDASVAVKWVLDEEGADAALSLQSQSLAAPTIWLVEAASALWRRSRLGEIDAAEAGHRLARLQTAPVIAIPIEPDLPDALNLALQLRHPIYDCIYLAAAIREDTYVVTADTRFLSAVSRKRSLKKHVRLLV